jgi:N utilization substance protein B
MLERSRARRQALQILYQREITGEAVSRILETGSYNPEDGEPSEFCRTLVYGVEGHQEEIDSYLSDISEHWTVTRMPLVDRNILRLAVYEILFVEDIPDSVSINEAVEMAKSYGGDDSSKFVNGVLGRLAEIRSDDMREHSVEDG